ncbi:MULTISPECIES: SCO family protein [unclassified Novosphingobium]|uniref:SCO family protein n=1 Tax=unclassified Novosphingobium TaxID=2644732 RepID=UPI0025D9885A|nr:MULTISPECIES: SCO family protein [unclassified Novosphingobium]HQV02201.1 SCO family protein [Novosphingobium sp.]
MTKPIFTLAFAALALSACSQAERKEEPKVTGALIDGAAIGGPFTLTDKDGKRVSWDDFKGKYRIVYFGYTFCPDACPMDLSILIRGFTEFAKDHPQQAAEVQPIFITIDPARDTPTRVGEFTAAFSPRLIGLTGSQAEVDVAVKAFKAVAARGADTPGGYLMDHSRMAYLMGKNGEPIAALPVDKDPATVAADLAALVK